MKAVVLAGGLGTRLHPLTSNIPKPMVPVTNKPLMEFIIRLLAKHGITDITVLLFHQPHIIKSHFGDGKEFGVQISYVEATQDYGTAGAVRLAAQQFSEPFLVISADLVTDFNLSKAVEYHKTKNADVTILLTRVENPVQYGIVITDREGKIKNFLEKPSWSEIFSDTINTGIYLVDPQVLSYMPEGKSFDFSHDLFPLLLANKGALYGLIMEGFWKDIGSIEEYARVHAEILKNSAPVIHPTAKVSKSAKIEGFAVIGENSVVGDEAVILDTVIGSNCQVGRGSKLREGVVWDSVIIGSQVEAERVVIGRGCYIDDRVVLEDGAIIADDVRIGKDAIVKPRVKIWPSKIIEEGSVVSRTMVLRERYPKTIFKPFGVTGLVNIELTPEFVSNLGVAYGNIFPAGSHITASRDSHKASRMIYRAFISGVLASGVNIFNLENVPIPVTRYDLATSRSFGGIHVRKSPFDQEVVDIKFFDEDGMDFSSTKEKKVERLFFGEEFRKVNIQEVGELSFPFHRVVEQYREGILSHINAEAIRCKNCRLIIDYAYGAASQVFPNILGDLEFDMVALNAHVDEMKITKSKDVFDKSLIRLSQIVKSVEGDLGVMFDAGAEKLFLCDEKGEILSGDKALAVVVYLFLLTHPGETVAVPINTSAAIEIIAKKFGSVVLRTKSASRDMMEVAAKQERVKFVGERLGGFIFPEFQPSFDAMFATCKIIEMINQSKVRLSEIVKEVPEPHVFKKDISCLPELKGRVMRSLVEDIKEGQIDLLDGVKVSFGDRWILVLPHPMRPIIELYAESPKEKEAQKLLQEYTRKIDDILS